MLHKINWIFTSLRIMGYFKKSFIFNADIHNRIIFSLKEKLVTICMYKIFFFFRDLTLRVLNTHRWHAHPLSSTAVQLSKARIQHIVTGIALINSSQVIIVRFMDVLATVISRDMHVGYARGSDDWITSFIAGVVISGSHVVGYCNQK